MEVPEQRRHILYIEGEPRWEYKFIRRALEDDSPIRVASLLKTTPNKFYRQGIESADELSAGFPTDETHAVQVRRADDRQLRGRCVVARSARHDPRVRRPPRRHAADDGRPARARRRRLGPDERRRGAARAAADGRGADLRAQPCEGQAHGPRQDVADYSARDRRCEEREVVERDARAGRLRASRRAQARRRGAARGRLRGPHRSRCSCTSATVSATPTSSRRVAPGVGRCCCRTRISATSSSGGSCSKRSRRARRNPSRSRRSRCSTATKAR